MAESIKSDEQREEIELGKTRRQQVIANAYHEVFKTEAGRVVIEDLTRAFGIDRPAFVPLIKGHGNGSAPDIMGYDPIHAAKRDGQRDVILHIQAKLAVPVTGDANINKPKRRIRR